MPKNDVTVQVDQKTRRGNMKCETGKPAVIIEERRDETLISEKVLRTNATFPQSLKADSGSVVMREAPTVITDRSGGYGKAVHTK